MKTILIGSDRGTSPFMRSIMHFVRSLGYEVEAVASDAQCGLPYHAVAEALCHQVIESGYQKEGIALCAASIGTAISANKYKGIRASAWHRHFSQECPQDAFHCNVLCLGTRFMEPELAKEVIQQWLASDLAEGGGE